MPTHPVRSLVVAVATTLALLLVHSSPASASTVPVQIGGWATAAGNVIELNPGGGAETPPCSEKFDSTSFTASSPGTWTLTGSFSRFFQLGWPPSGQWYQADFLILSASGTYSGSSPSYFLATGAPNHMVFRIRMYLVGAGHCEKDNLACTITSRVVGQGHFDGTLPSPSAGHIGYISAASNNAGGNNMVVSGCTAPFVSWAGQVLSFAAFEFRV
ncbi:MAG TPA: hypothetical protein VGO60_17895 [Iamia sp.]|jgi:hypothetical protein|nr:hypothetical protein [Iamia sp.]